MSKGKVILIGLVISLLVPIIHLITLEVSTSYKNSSQSQGSHISLLKKLVQQGDVDVAAVGGYSQGNLHIAYWYSYTIIDFLIDFTLSMLVYLLIVVTLRLLRLKILNHNKR